LIIFVKNQKMVNIDNILKDTKFWSYFKGDVNDIIKKWSEPHRYFHTIENHLEKILDHIELDKDKYSKLEYDMMRITAIYHDVIYLQGEKDSINIKKSIEYFEKDFPEMIFIFKDKIKDIIDSTEGHNFECEDKLCRNFNYYDMFGILHNTGEELIESNDLVAKEQSSMDFDTFRNNNINFLRKYVKYNPEIEKFITYMQNKKSF